MPILTLTTDWGICDPSVGSFKGSLLSRNLSLQIIDISHDIRHFDTLTAAYVVKTTFRKFPKGTIHFIGLCGEEEQNIDCPYIIVETEDHFLVGYDSGVFSLILDNEESKKIYSIKAANHGERKKNEELILEALTDLTNGKSAAKIGELKESYVINYFAFPTIDANAIRATIIYIDSFGNAVLNITKEVFDKECKNRPFVIYMRRSEYIITKISSSYEDVSYGEIVAFFNSNDQLEIALNKSKAAGLLGLKVMDAIRIDFK